VSEVNIKREIKSSEVLLQVHRVKKDKEGNPILDENGNTIFSHTENLGRVSYYHKNPIKRFFGNLEVKVRRKILDFYYSHKKVNA